MNYSLIKLESFKNINQEVENCFFIETPVKGMFGIFKD